MAKSLTWPAMLGSWSARHRSLGPSRIAAASSWSSGPRSPTRWTRVNSATAVNARIIRREPRIGTIEVGKVADVIAIDGDPLADSKLFDDPARIVLVIKDGQVVKDAR